MKAAIKKAPLLETLEEALALLQSYGSANVSTDLVSEPLPSLLAQCEALIGKPQDNAFRTIHHFASTGGTLISKCISAQPNIVLLSEIDPLSLIGVSLEKPVFTPRSVIQQLRYSLRGNSDDLILKVFQSEVSTLSELLLRRGQSLVLRDHAHSHYCMGSEVADRPGLRDMLLDIGPTRSIVTVRHPIDSFLSLVARTNWNQISPHTLEEYSRRYERFLDDHAGIPIFQYEEFLRAPEAQIRGMCEALGLPYEPGAMELRDVFNVSGASGRSGIEIAPRPRRDVPAEFAEQVESEGYQRLCHRLGYEPALDQV